MVVLLAVRQAVLLVEVLRVEGNLALGALEAVRVPVLAHRPNVVVLKRGEEEKVRRVWETAHYLGQIALKTGQ